MKFTVYSKNGCCHCTKIQQVLELSHLPHTIYKLEEDFTRDQFYAEFGQGSTFPQVLMNDTQHLGGCAETVKYLQENNII